MSRPPKAPPGARPIFPPDAIMATSASPTGQSAGCRRPPRSRAATGAVHHQLGGDRQLAHTPPGGEDRRSGSPVATPTCPTGHRRPPRLVRDPATEPPPRLGHGPAALRHMERWRPGLRASPTRRKRKRAGEGEDARVSSIARVWCAGADMPPSSHEAGVHATSRPATPWTRWRLTGASHSSCYVPRSRDLSGVSRLTRR
jgi:hypothetical protein